MKMKHDKVSVEDRRNLLLRKKGYNKTTVIANKTWKTIVLLIVEENLHTNTLTNTVQTHTHIIELKRLRCWNWDS